MLLRSAAIALPLVVAGFCSLSPALAQGKSTLSIGQNADLTSFDPTELRAGTYVSTHLLYNSLIRLDAEGKPQPELAQSWTRSEDGKTLTLKLQPNVKFHDGRPMTSKDVAFSFDYAKTPAVGANILPLAQMISKIDTPDDQTVVMTLVSASDAIYDLLDLAFIVDSKHPKTIKTSGMGTGPFKLTDYEPGQQITFVRNENYWRQKPAISRVTIKIIPDLQSSVAQLRAGTIDFLPLVSREALEQLSGTGLKTGVAAAEGRVLDIGINTKAKVFDNPDVRRAVNLAIDRARIAHDVVGGNSVPKCLPWPVRSKREATGMENSCKYDLAAAKALIEKAGATGAQVELLSYSQAEPALGAMAQILQDSLKQIGLTATISEMSEAAFVARFRKSNFQFTTHFYVRAGRSPSAVLLTAVPFRSKGNVSGIDSKQYQDDVALVTSAKPGADTDAAFKRINTFLLDQAWVLPVATLPVQWASTPKLEGVTFNLDGMPIFEKASVR
ncbi:MAG: ABC transporter substrate-binding protein [Proteobacteria bacterium]|nr:ABC transporter substrate-binding protein [Pseudomonadota bacterium]